MRALLVIMTAGLALQPAISPAADVYLFDLLKRPQYRRSYNAMLSTTPDVPKWISYYSRTMDGPSQPVHNIKADGEPYLVGDVCKVHDCLDHKLQVVFASNGQRAWGRVFENGSIRWIGDPPPALRKAVERIDF